MTWLIILWSSKIIFIVIIVGFNALLSGRGGPMSVLKDTSAVLIQTPTLTIPGVNWHIHITITALRVFFALTQMMRMFTMDLAFRFIPMLGRGFSITVDAQRARG